MPGSYQVRRIRSARYPDSSRQVFHMPLETSLPTIALTMGDPAGVGAEVVIKALADPAIAPLANWIVCGDSRVLAMAEQCTGTRLQSAEVRDIRALESFEDFAFGKLDRKSTRLNSSHRCIS